MAIVLGYFFDFEWNEDERATYRFNDKLRDCDELRTFSGEPKKIQLVEVGRPVISRIIVKRRLRNTAAMVIVAFADRPQFAIGDNDDKTDYRSHCPVGELADQIHYVTSPRYVSWLFTM